MTLSGLQGGSLSIDFSPQGPPLPLPGANTSAVREGVIAAKTNVPINAKITASRTTAVVLIVL